jgi:hypothetical protein
MFNANIIPKNNTATHMSNLPQTTFFLCIFIALLCNLSNSWLCKQKNK